MQGDKVLVCEVDSPQKKLENARTQKVTNFKLGVSGIIATLLLTFS